MRYTILSIILATVIFSSCSSSKKTGSVQLAPVTVKASSGEYRATTDRHWDILHTRVALKFNFTEKTADGEAWIDIKPYIGTDTILKLDAKSMEINSVTVNNENAEYSYEEDVLSIMFPTPVSGTQRIHITYKAMPYKTASGGSSAITDDRGLYFINTDNAIPNKPVQIWTQGETEANSHWVPTIDKPNEKFTTQVEMTVPDSFVTLSNGYLVDQQKNGNTRTDIWKMDKPIQPYAMMMAIGKYSIVDDGEWNGIPVNYYVEPEYAPYAKEMFKHTREMMAFFSDLTYVDYPWNKYSQVVVRDFVSGAMENTTASVFGEFINQTSRELKDEDHEDVVAHELFHQWFGDYATAESWSNITLNESFATFGEQLWLRHKYGKVAEQRLAFEDLHRYLEQAKKNDPPLVRYVYNDKDDVFDRVSYQKGAIILRYFEGLISTEAFRLAMKEYLNNLSFSSGEVAHWRLAVEKVTGKDWNWFFNQWYFRGGHPILEFDYKYDDDEKTVTIKVEQKQTETYHLPLTVSLVSDSKKQKEQIDINATSSRFTLPYPRGERPIVIPDVEHWLPGEIIENKSYEDWLKHYAAADKDDLISKITPLKNNYKNLNNKTIQQLFKQAFNDPEKEVRAYAIEYILASENKSIKNTWENDILFLAINDPSNDVRALAFDLLGYWEIKSGEEHMLAAIEDSSYMVAGSALAALNSIEYDSVYQISKALLKTNPKGYLLPEIWLIIGEQGFAADTTYFNKEVYNVFSTDKVDFVIALGSYMKSTTDNDAFENALAHAKYLITTENIKSYRSVMTSYIYEVAFYYKEDTTPGANKNKANIRMRSLLMALDEIEAAETDEKNLWEYKKYRALLLK